MTRLTLPAPDRFSLAGKTPVPAERAELVVIGAGAAGCAAAAEAARAGARVILVDENPVSPGLIGTDVPFHFGGRATAAVQKPERLVERLIDANPALGEAFELGVDVRLSTSAWGAWVNGPGLRSLGSGGVVGLADEARSWLLGFDRLIVATGARDLTLSFAGSDQPGVMGAQALHALLARYEAFAGHRLVVLGTGELAVRTAELALEHGLQVAALVEARDTPQGEPARLAALVSRGVAVITAHVPLAAESGPDGVSGIVLVRGSGERRTIGCDTICLAVGAVPVIELLDVLGARREMATRRGGHVPVVGADGATSLPHVFAAGDCTGLGADAAAAGRAAARAALRSLGREVETAALPEASPPGPDALAYQLDWARALLATGGEDVLACACEDVTRGELLAVQPPRYLGWRSNAIARRSLGTLAADGPLDQDQIKRLTRACMGACQARRCREQVALMMALGANVAPETIPLAGYRSPVRPLPLAVLADADEPATVTDNWNVWFGISTQWISYDDIGTAREDEQLRAGMPY